ncbi:hypothetical protein GGR51DRAFT_320398 [Nemania sp. FL0031]|nr:hypothetical protein GGR51DRAFT_320398 [Nemania sp. FL0031]
MMMMIDIASVAPASIRGVFLYGLIRYTAKSLPNSRGFPQIIFNDNIRYAYGTANIGLHVTVHSIGAEVLCVCIGCWCGVCTLYAVLTDSPSRPCMRRYRLLNWECWSVHDSC